MTRATRFATAVAAFGLVYVLLLLHIMPLPWLETEVRDAILPTLPWWALVATGSWLLGNVGWGLWNFNDVPEAYQELMGDIKDAKEFLASKGVDI